MVQVLVGASVAFAVALMATPAWTRWLRARGLGQPIQDEVTHHTAKAGTPTMGGLVLSAAVVVAYVGAIGAGGHGPTMPAVAVLVVVAGGAVVGLTDDWLKIRRSRNTGLREAQKTTMLLAVIGAFCALYLFGPRPCTHLSFTSCQSTGWDLGPVGWSALALVLLWGSANSTNFTDGIEGLLAGSALPSFTVLAAIGFWEFRHPGSYRMADPLGLSVLAAAMAGACAGFLWWNIQPMRIFMGDTGSLAIGTAMAALALSMDIAALLPVLAALYVAEGGSSALQRYTYKLYFKKRPGQRRLFRMAPLHHHFELKGWADSTLVVRFWIVSSMAGAAAAAIFYGAALRWR
ncbi:MAG TPA: phospho-N-acetylmuramoyl-pentapeptide-transferase [Acidimicrobiales bacterium]|nr:phospho-N-acetylmuramoyl-pentapeptide-transferase [Acidimicrobiales bacterium]